MVSIATYRYQIKFDQKPDQETLQVLRNSKLQWMRYDKCWVTDSIADLNACIKELEKLNGEH
jgi:hypothetical protein